MPGFIKPGAPGAAFGVVGMFAALGAFGAGGALAAAFGFFVMSVFAPGMPGVCVADAAAGFGTIGNTGLGLSCAARINAGSSELGRGCTSALK